MTCCSSSSTAVVTLFTLSMSSASTLAACTHDITLPPCARPRQLQRQHFLRNDALHSFCMHEIDSLPVQQIGCGWRLTWAQTRRNARSMTAWFPLFCGPLTWAPAAAASSGASTCFVAFITDQYVQACVCRLEVLRISPACGAFALWLGRRCFANLVRMLWVRRLASSNTTWKHPPRSRSSRFP